MGLNIFPALLEVTPETQYITQISFADVTYHLQQLCSPAFLAEVPQVVLPEAAKVAFLHIS